jgi:enoyl-CoA hydratase
MSIGIERRDGGTVVVTIERPEALNALNRETLSELRDRLRELAVDTDARVLVLTGAGERALAAGAVLNEMMVMSCVV